ncbi:alpha/beta hydrolase [Microbacterium sp. Se63.02b]|uniref:alpha/beta fold hydrolase n=1 Tax=Microbacterium sp. Se63.02b TaxID=2709304 RepID=UPI00237BAFB3|nr:alpha/beta hydrolase [Microbacterium sp. Se63.02b]
MSAKAPARPSCSTASWVRASWWRVVPRLVDRGRRVIALDLPGHGLSPRDPELTIERAASAVVDTVRVLAPGGPVDAIGHSYGATVLAAAAEQLRPDLAVYVDAALVLAGGADRHALTAAYAQDRLLRMSPDGLRATRPFSSERDAEVEARAAARFDPATSASVSCGPDQAWEAVPGSIVIRADPSAWVTDQDARRFEQGGVEVRSVPGAAHTIWYSHFDEFTASLPEMFGGR